MTSNLEHLVIRKARLEDVETIVRLSNAGGPTGPRETLPEKLPETYYDAFRRIDADPRAHLMVAELGGRVAGTFHLLFIPFLAGKGREDAHLEAVHVAADLRRRGIGAAMVQWAIAEARKRNR